MVGHGVPRDATRGESPHATPPGWRRCVPRSVRRAAHPRSGRGRDRGADPGGVAAHGVALWNGTAWQTLGTGVAGPLAGPRATVRSLAQAANGDLVVGGVSLNNAVVAYDKVDRIKVAPNSNLARVGGVRFPKQLARFEAAIPPPINFAFGTP